MRIVVPTLFVICSSVMFAAEPLPVAPEPHEIRAEPYLRDLKLTAATTAKTVKPVEMLPITLTLENTSKTSSYFVVKAGDGSECGWHRAR